MRPSFQRSSETRSGRSASGTKPSAFQSVMERWSLKRLSLPLLKTCVKSGPFAPRALPRFLATMGRSDSRPRPPRGYGFPRGVAPPRRTTPGLPGPSLLLSTRALPTHPGQPDACMRSLLPHQLQASSSSADWPLPLVSRGRIGFAYAGLASSPSQLVSHSPGLRRTGPFHALGCPPAPDRGYMVNEQFTWLTPLSQRERVGLPWRNRRHDGAKRKSGNQLRRANAAQSPAG